MGKATAETTDRTSPRELMKFLIDECLHTSLVTLAQDAGHVCEHANFLGLGGHKDWQLMTRIRREDYTFVTNNRTDFTALYAREELHAGLVIILPNVTPSRQRDIFRAALSHVGKRDLVNAVLEVDLSGATAICREYPYPLPIRERCPGAGVLRKHATTSFQSRKSLGWRALTVPPKIPNISATL